MTGDMWQVTRDTWHIVWDEQFLKISAPKLFRFAIEGVLNIYFHKPWLTLLTLMSDKAVYRTAPATPGLLNIWSEKNHFFDYINQ